MRTAAGGRFRTFANGCFRPRTDIASVAAARLPAPQSGCDRKRIDHLPINIDNLALCLVGITTYGNLGKALLDAKRYDEAAIVFETTLKLDPSLGGAYNNLTVIYIDHLKQKH